MRAYKLTYKIEESAFNKYAETQKLARALRRDIMEQNQLKLADVEISQIEIPTKKTEFLAWLNSL